MKGEFLMNKYVDFNENSRGYENTGKDYLVILFEMIVAFFARARVKTVIYATVFIVGFIGTVAIVGGIEAGLISLSAGFPLLFILSLIAIRSTRGDEE